MRGNISKLSSLTLATLIALSALVVFAPNSVKAITATMQVINPLDGTHDFNFTTGTLDLNQFVVINITAVDVTDLQNWQIKLTWNASYLTYQSIALPADHVFSGSGKTMITPPPDTGAGYVVWGCTYINDPYWTFNGTGRLCVVTLKVIAKPQIDPPGPGILECDLALVNKGSDTFMLNGAGLDITFSFVNGHYFYEWVAPPGHAQLYIKPSTIKPDKLGDIFSFEVWARNVYSDWRYIGIQFSIMWNTTFMKPAAPYYANGTFFESFAYYPGGVLYAADIDTHNRLPPMHAIPDGYNYSMFSVILLPDSPPADPYHTPFPNGEGKLMTVYFEAIYETISPTEAWTQIQFITFDYDEDCYALNSYLTVYGLSTVPAQYRAPMKILGLAIDLYTQYESPYGGQGADQPSDMFGPQQQVDLFALVTYNEYPVQQKLVGFEIRHGDYIFWREATTDSDGIAHVAFRLPWPCVDPVGEIFGKWIVYATVEVAEKVENDTLGFWVWWKVHVLSIEPKQTEFTQRKTGGDPLKFTVTYGTHSMQILPAIITATIYDELGFFIGADDLGTTVGHGEYVYYDYLICEEPPFLTYTWNVTIPLPTNAVVGKGLAFGNAFDAFPWFDGTPYCPEVTNTIDFYIVKP